ncbi:Zinc/iron permease [Piromyces finnis]|uniref:Zinc/iron permease n=1 Tax=Piromyces finnis TaxID=1754191 RepID=A0A1Y1UVN6_9FUNG|nr:Zinc/iron permease [Piromyces finnis]|eukprot:ORX41997.1 Zinc/iron permease [Piromyces finnis]
MKYYQFLLLCLLFIQIINAHGIHHHDDEEEGEEHDHEHEEDEEQYAAWVTILGIVGIIACSFIGTILPVIYSKKSIFKESSLFFSCVKLFGTGVILSTAFIHMIIPSDQILTSEYTNKLFNEKYTSFAGVFAILGIVITHVVQVYTIKQYLETDLSNPENVYHEKNSKTISIADVDGCVEEQHGILHLMENKEKQTISYLLEIGISLHSILIGIAFGMTRDKELIVLMVALMFHQFFEGISLSSVFVEAHFKHAISIIVMIITYSCTLPIGGIIGLLIRSSVESTNSAYLTIQGIIDAVAGGILVYDDTVNILSRHCNSDRFKASSLGRKNIQLICFYLGILTLAIIGIWA